MSPKVKVCACGCDLDLYCEKPDGVNKKVLYSRCPNCTEIYIEYEYTHE